MASFRGRIKHAWNAFLGRDAPIPYNKEPPPSYSRRPDRIRRSLANERTMLNAVINRMAVDAAQFKIEHCRVNDNEQYQESIDSQFNDILNHGRPNIDQGARAFLQDAYESLLDQGTIAIFPTDYDDEPEFDENGDPVSTVQILSLRVAEVVAWGAHKVRCRLWNDNSGRKDEIEWSKSLCFIIQNPFYSIMNEPNALLRRVSRKMVLLDQVSEQASSGKLDMILQLPYSVKNPIKRAEAQKRKRDIEMQLTDSKYGIAYIDASEKITQLNRPIENNLLSQIEYLTNLFYSQLGVTNEIMNGTADEKTMLNYYYRCIEPIVAAVCEEFESKYLTKTARTQGQRFKYFRDPFKVVPVSELAEVSDKLTRNEIATSNEIRGIIGWKPSSDPKADELRNSNVKQEGSGEEAMENQPIEEEEQMMNESYAPTTPAETIIPGG